MLKSSYGGGSFKSVLRKVVPIVGIVGLAGLMLWGLFAISAGSSDEECKKVGLSGGGLFNAGMCGVKDEAKAFQNIVLVVGATQNTPKPNLEGVKDYFMNSMVKYDDVNVSTILVSEPYWNPDRLRYDKFDQQTNTVSQYVKNLKDIIADIDSKVENLAAADDGADYLEAIRTAAHSLKSGQNSIIIVVGSGLSDKGLVNFANDDLLNKEITESSIIEGVKKEVGNDRELDKVKIVWDGVGTTVLPQSPLNSDEKDKIKKIYDGVLSKMGAEEVKFIDSLNSRANVKTSNKVKTTKTYGQKIDIYVEYDETTSVKFNGNEATFVNRSEAEKELMKYVDEMLSKKNTMADITAYMAHGQTDCSEGMKDEQLLANRANAVKDFFASKGVAKDRVNIALGGFGSENECPSGEYAETQAMKNRKVTIHIYS